MYEMELNEKVGVKSEKLKHQFSQVEGDLNSKGDP
jgi:hypothetical protein